MSGVSLVTAWAVGSEGGGGVAAAEKLAALAALQHAGTVVLGTDDSLEVHLVIPGALVKQFDKVSWRIEGFHVLLLANQALSVELIFSIGFNLIRVHRKQHRL